MRTTRNLEEACAADSPSRTVRPAQNGLNWPDLCPKVSKTLTLATQTRRCGLPSEEAAQSKPRSLFSDPPGPSPPPARSSHAQPLPGDASSTIPDGSTPPQTSASSRESLAL